MNDSQKHIEVTISRSAFANNIRWMRERMAPARLCVVMKSDAYGHGLSALLETAIAAGADYLGICTNVEAAEVRRKRPEQPVMRLRAALPDELSESVERLNVEEMVGSREVAEFLNRLGRERSRPVPVHLKVDTGMGRTGFLSEELDDARRVCTMEGLRVRGIMTHLPCADAADLTTTRRQLEQFQETAARLADDLPDDVLVHSHNSAASIRLPQLRNDMVRVGAACYGVRTSTDFANPDRLRPVMSVRTRIMEVRSVPAGRPIGYGSLFRTERPSRIATLPVGFGEGYPRALFNKGIVLINGQRCPVVGRVSLNVTTVDITDLDGDARPGDEAVLVGSQGGESVTFEELADLFASVHTEINLMAGCFNHRVYVD
ncbi:MAG: alanine racemase [Pseudomonadota bacterium]|nr:alanine racemase [Pseudomonadota bacterium]